MPRTTKESSRVRRVNDLAEAGHLHRCQNGGRRHSGEHIEGPGEFIRAVFVHFQPSLSLIIGHREHAIVTFLAVVHDRPGNRAAEQDQRKGRDLGGSAALDKRDDEADDAHREPVNGQRVDQNMNVLRLAEILEELRRS